MYTYPETNNANEDAQHKNAPYDVPPVVAPTPRQSQRTIWKPNVTSIYICIHGHISIT